jgi:hypothetical protein
MTWMLDERARSITVRAERAGSLAALPGDELPELVPVVPPQGSGARVRAWLTAAPVPEPHLVWHRLARAFAVSGLWPLVASGAWDRPFRGGWLAAPAPVPEAESVLRGCWRGIRPVLPDGTAPPSRPWPGLAPGTGAPDGGPVLLPGPPNRWSGDLLLVPTTRPADATARLGWTGAGNWFLSGADVAAVLRSWEDRFGAYVVSIGAAAFDLVVTRPPATDEQCLLLADEHYCFCPEIFSPQDLAEPVPHRREEYAELLRGARRWYFWWDRAARPRTRARSRAGSGV